MNTRAGVVISTGLLLLVYSSPVAIHFDASGSPEWIGSSAESVGAAAVIGNHPMPPRPLPVRPLQPNTEAWCC